MATHQMIALTALSYGGKKLKINDAFEAKGAHARVLVALKKAKFSEAAVKPAPAPKPATPAPKPAPKPAPTPPTPANPAAKAATAEPAAESTAVGAMTTKNAYKTRDLKPE